MKYTTGYYGSSISRNTFKTFIAMWLAIFAIAICAMFVFSTQAKADILLAPELQLHKKTPVATIAAFTTQASPENIEHHCKSLLSPTQSEVMPEMSFRNRRNVGLNGDLSIIKAIKAYRACTREATLKELSKK